MRLRKNLVRRPTLLKVGPRQLLWQLGTKRGNFVGLLYNIDYNAEAKVLTIEIQIS